MPTDVVVIVKCITDRAGIALLTRSSQVRVWDSIGMLTVALDLDRKQATESVRD